jgi:hypothetical protein
MMTEGKKYEKPKELDEFITAEELREKSLRYMRNLTAKAIESLEVGNEGGSAKLLLELVLMTITPVRG